MSRAFILDYYYLKPWIATSFMILIQSYSLSLPFFIIRHSFSSVDFFGFHQAQDTQRPTTHYMANLTEESQKKFWKERMLYVNFSMSRNIFLGRSATSDKLKHLFSSSFEKQKRKMCSRKIHIMALEVWCGVQSLDLQTQDFSKKCHSISLVLLHPFTVEGK